MLVVLLVVVLLLLLMLLLLLLPLLWQREAVLEATRWWQCWFGNAIHASQCCIHQGLGLSNTYIARHVDAYSKSRLQLAETTY